MKELIDIKEIEKYYDITEDGLVYSKIRKRWLKPQRNQWGYVYYFIRFPYNRWIYGHTLVAFKFIGLPPSRKHEVNHKNGNRIDNHYSNLEWVTHSQNQHLAYDNGRGNWWRDHARPPVSLETKLKMSNAKKKRVKVNGVVYESIGDACESLGIERRTFNRKWNKIGVEVIYDELLISDSKSV
jgi:hypothetical protein